MRPTIVYTWLWLALLSFRDLTIPAIVGSQDTLTLSMVVWGLFNASGAGPASATTMVMIALLVPLTALFLWAAGRGGRGDLAVGPGWRT
jgi:iron(III) transport system permease protein